MSKSISKRELDRLEMMFTAEIAHALSKSDLPQMYQCRPSKLMTKLKEKGLVEKVENRRTFWGDMRFEGWILTHSGRFTYCESLSSP
jgi:hypothetical protein